MGEPEVLRWAADILEKRFASIANAARGKRVNTSIISDLVCCGVMHQTKELLRELADELDGSSSAK